LLSLSKYLSLDGTPQRHSRVDPSGVLPNADADGDLLLNPAAAKALFENMKVVIHPVKG
jgi:hypothetical protein